jgi:hypothetical protein
MPNEAEKLIKQQPLDRDDPNKYYPFPALAGLVKPPRPATQPVHRLPLQLVSGRDRGKPAQGTTTVSASPFHGVTRLAVVAGDNISQTFNNGKGDVDPQGQVLPGGKKGRYYDEVTDNFRLDPDGDRPKICWKVRNTDGFTKARFELFSRDRAEPIWSLTWDKSQIAANIRSGALAAGAKEKAGQKIPIRWTGSLDWAETVGITDPAYPAGRLTPGHAPYQLRLTINDGDPGPNKMGYPLIAWTYIYITGETVGDTTPAQEIEVVAALAETLRQAAQSGVPFCEGFEAFEVSLGISPAEAVEPEELETPTLEPEPSLDGTGPQQKPAAAQTAMLAETLRQAALAGIPFCEGIEAVLDLPLPEKLSGEVTTLSEILRQAAQSGVPFCEGFEAILGDPIPGPLVREEMAG